MTRTITLATILVAVLAAAVSTQAPPTAGIVQGDAAHRVDDYLTRLVPYGFSGAVLVAKDGQVVLPFGREPLAWNQPCSRYSLRLTIRRLSQRGFSPL